MLPCDFSCSPNQCTACQISVSKQLTYLSESTDTSKRCKDRFLLK